MPERDDRGYPPLPERPTIPKLRRASQECRGCDLYKRGTRTVFGEGPSRARVLLVGEQPGDKEDLAGRPFVGPAGRLLDEGLDAAGIDRGQVYVTNAVKHFKWRAAGKRRIHEKPNAREIAACRLWLDLELSLVKPRVVVALGATAAQALLGPKFRVTKERGKAIDAAVGHVIATVHSSSILRAPDDAARRAEMKAFIGDLRAVARALGRP
ncbi:MAG TPA: UdgX family uracil-DNA binding protein [Candidatus Limnocylindria bacterium]|nr:UdgX family uracil-DNA binding protein [Candidatus Limnocylindria bacterium]